MKNLGLKKYWLFNEMMTQDVAQLYVSGSSQQCKRLKIG